VPEKMKKEEISKNCTTPLWENIGYFKLNYLFPTLSKGILAYF